MNWKRNLCGLVMSTALMMALPLTAQATDYSFTTDAPQNYYKGTNYEDTYGSQYNYGGRNVVDYQVPELEYGVQSTTMTGVMERTILPGLQQTVATGLWHKRRRSPYSTHRSRYRQHSCYAHVGHPHDPAARLHQRIRNGLSGREHRHGENPLAGYQHESLGG